MQVLLYPNRIKDADFSVTRQTAALLSSCGAAVLADSAFAVELRELEICFLPLAEAFAKADLVLTIGGDGTLLQAGADCITYHKPVLGINLGRTGFLATCELAELPEKVTRLARGEFTLEPRSLLAAACEEQDWHETAINDVVLYGKSRLHPMDYTILCDDVPVGRYRCDGIIAATPTGSTAYAFSAGGAVLDAWAQMMELIPICPQGGRRTPLVFAAGRRLRILTAPENRDNVILCADSQNPIELTPGQAVELSIADSTLPLISFDHAEQFRAVVNKLLSIN